MCMEGRPLLLLTRYRQIDQSTIKESEKKKNLPAKIHTISPSALGQTFFLKQHKNTKKQKYFTTWPSLGEIAQVSQHQTLEQCCDLPKGRADVQREAAIQACRGEATYDAQRRGPFVEKASKVPMMHLHLPNYNGSRYEYPV